jgi:hypothetical protein
MVACRGTTKRGTPCRKKATDGKAYCWVHGQSKPSNGMLDDLVAFVQIAASDLATLATMKKQYCLESLPRDIRDDMARRQAVLDRVLMGSASDSIPGLMTLVTKVVDGTSTMTQDSLVQLRRKFTEQFRALTVLIVRHCRVHRTAFRLPDVKLSFSTTHECNGKKIPDELRAWLENDADQWKDKQIMCAMSHQGERVTLPVGLVLVDGFEVVIAHDTKEVYGIARPKDGGEGCLTWACIIARLLRYGANVVGRYISPILRVLWVVIRGTTRVSTVLLKNYWAMLLALVAVAIVWSSPQLLTFIPDGLRQTLWSVVTQSRDILTRRITAASIEERHVALWIAHQLGTHKKQLLMIGPPPTRLMIAPPPPRPNIPTTGVIRGLIAAGALSAMWFGDGGALLAKFAGDVAIDDGVSWLQLLGDVAGLDDGAGLESFLSKAVQWLA